MELPVTFRELGTYSPGIGLPLEDLIVARCTRDRDWGYEQGRSMANDKIV